MNTVSFMTANFVARQLDYSMTGDWGQGDRATNAYFSPIETYHERLDAMFAEIRDLGFGAIDLWTAHLNPTWATDEHIAVARGLLDQYGFTVSSLAAGFGATREVFDNACAIALAVGAPIFGGNIPLIQQDRAYVVGKLNEHGLVYAYENHPERSPAELLEKVGDSEGGAVAVCVDTGWFGTHSMDAVQAIEELGGRIAHIHLKDVLAAGAHNTCAYGEGVVPIEGCVRTLQRIGYTGGISIEHEPEHERPHEAIRKNLALVQQWLKQ
jgi:L-ribulose-5-phosphate 3-epimerase